MKLKSLKIVGFKSFANPTTINFESGFTAIVGPNGSGKSNIIEAIRWVLGEQSAKNLRGNKMNDVIFSGSDNHRSLNRAEVSLTFDNSDHYLNSKYSEITITRRIFRDGQGEYLLNQNECRLKDINNLLVDSGIGKGSFSIISQGNVEKIFNSKPEDRRTIIETTAGIYKYKLQKEQAEKKLTVTNENLDRVNDIVFELSTQVKRLKTQSETAQKYLDLKKKVGRLNDVKLTYTLFHLQNKLKDDSQKRQALLNTEKESQEQIKQLSFQKETVQQNLHVALASNDKLQEQLLKTSNQVEKQISKKQLASQTNDFKEEQLSNLNSEIKSAKLQQRKLLEQKKSIQQKYEEAEKKLQALNQNAALVSDKSLNQQITAANQRILQLHNQHFEITQQINDLNQALELKKQSREQSRQRFGELQKSLKDHRTHLLAYENDFKAVKQQRLELQNDLQEQLALQKKCQKTLESKTSEMNNCQNQWYDSLKKVQQLESRVDGLKQAIDNHVGFYQGSQELLKAKLNGVIGAVSDFVRVDSQYTMAIDTALGNRVQQVIVENRSAAHQALNYLKQQRLGRATVLPKDNLSDHHINDSILSNLQHYEGFINTGDQLVMMPEKLKLVRRYLLGNVLVVKTLHDAFTVSDMVQHRFKVVTLDGQVVNAGGSVTGGAKKNNRISVLAQQTELAKKVAAFNELKELNQSLEQKLQALKKTVKTTQDELTKVNHELNPRQPEVNRINSKYETLKNEITLIKEQIDSIQKSINKEAPNQFQSVDDAKKEELNQKLSENKNEIADLNAKIQQLTDDQSVTSESAQKLNQELKQQQQNLNDLKVELKNNQFKIDQNDNHLKTLIQQEADLNNNQHQAIDINALTISIQKNQKQIDEWQEKISSLKQQIDELQSKQSPLEKLISQHQNNLINIHRQLDRLQNQLDQTSSQIQNCQRTLAEQPSQLKINVSEIDIDQVRSDLNNLNQEIIGIGSVNINSIDEYDSVNERYQFLSGQAEDLKTAQEQLTRTMDKMDRTVRDKFKTTFDKLQVAFKETFVQIFGGGDAKLLLDDPHHLLTTGIEIMAQPPGKKYRNMSLLSGGERALTAIALLFATLKLTPVPFCILDEAESALDSANVDRFASYISKFKNQTQFIVITHRKETMVYADQLYGVTMQNSGVSQLIDVNLKQIQQAEDE